MDRPNEALNFLNGSALGVIRSDFLATLGKDLVTSSLFVGRLLSQVGDPIDGYHTFHGEPALIVRGSRQASFRICNQCGRPTYFAMGPSYLCPTPPRDCQIFDAYFGSLVITDEVHARLAGNRWKNVRIETLPVLEEPKDGCPVELGPSQEPL